MAPREAQLVASTVGDATARMMLLEAATFSAPEMLARGFLSRVVPAAELQASAQASVAAIAALAPQAARLNKRTLRALRPQLAEVLPQALGDPYAYADSAEHREGIGAFLAKRKPRFV